MRFKPGTSNVVMLMSHAVVIFSDCCQGLFKVLN